MEVQCPISEKLLNSHAARLTSVISLVLLSVMFSFQQYWILYVFLIDTFIRAFVDCKYSYLGKLSNYILSLLHIAPKMKNAGPLIFTAKIMFVFTVVLLICNALQLSLAFNIVFLILYACVFLYAAFNFCFGCIMYTALMSIKK